jgi:hypothetical protein
VHAPFWIALVSVAIALGSLVVSIRGNRVNARAIEREQSDRKQQIDDEWAREWAAQRPLVYPVVLREWAYAGEGTNYRLGNKRVLPLKNGGRGPALNVRGVVTALSPESTTYECELLAGTIAAGDFLDARLVPHPGVINWLGASGTLRYSDLVGGEYETRFDFAQNPHGEIAVTVHEQSTVSPP